MALKQQTENAAYFTLLKSNFHCKSQGCKKNYTRAVFNSYSYEEVILYFQAILSTFSDKCKSVGGDLPPERKILVAYSCMVYRVVTFVNWTCLDTIFWRLCTLFLL